MRLQKRGISRQMILESLSCYEVIEEYPDDKYFPSYLVYTHYQGEYVHILFAVDVEGDNVRIITAYRPNSIEWTTDLKTRRETQWDVMYVDQQWNGCREYVLDDVIMERVEDILQHVDETAELEVLKYAA
jgi:hypothetical protein